MEKEVKIFNENFNIKLTDIKGLKFLDSVEGNVEIKANTQEINGVDGVLLGASNFAPFNLIVNFSFKGLDTEDYRLVKQKLRGLIYRREPYYLWHSDMPGKKYAVYCEDNAIEDLTAYFGTFTITFVVYKGYSESMYDTSHIRNNDDTWQFEAGMEFNDDSLIYKHTTSGFKIYNGSDDKIDPLLNHNLIIYINIDAPNGFILWNRTTDEQFIYRKPVESSQAFTIKGVHPLLDGQRVGHNSNWQWITLEFVFNYIYR